MRWTVLVGFTLLASAQAFLRDGREYSYNVNVQIDVRTMDHAPTASAAMLRFKAIIQTEHGAKTLNVKFSDMQFSQYNGPLFTDGIHDTNFKKVGQDSVQFSVTLKEDGTFQSLAMDSGLSVFQKNIIRGWASQLQIKSTNDESMAFQSKEETVHGLCTVRYSMSKDQVFRSFVANEDCDWMARPFRMVDGNGGYFCDWDIPANEGVSTHDMVVYDVEPDGDAYKVKRMVTSGATIVQMFNPEGISFVFATNATFELVGEGASPGGIGGGDEVSNSLSFDFDDSQYKWDAERDLKAREPMITQFPIVEESQSIIKSAFIKQLEMQKKILHLYDTSEETIALSHKQGINVLLPLVAAMDYDTLMSLVDELMADKSEMGIMKANIFVELLASAGTSAAAIVVRDMVKTKKFDNNRDAARVLSGIPFHVRKPNIQLVSEMEELLDMDLGTYLEQSVPLSFGHLVRKTCSAAGFPTSNAWTECSKDFMSKYVTKFYQKFKATSSRKEKLLYLSVLSNIRFGGVADVLKPIILGKEETSPEIRANAIWSAGWEIGMKKLSNEYLMPLIGNGQEDHEVRTAALHLFFYTKPSAAQMARIINVAKVDKDIEFVNAFFGIMKSMAETINPCHKKTSELAANYFKYMKQMGGYDMDWRFGISKTYTREFVKSKYGYSGAAHFYTVGSHKSTTPLRLGMDISATLLEKYTISLFGVHMRIEGLAKGIIRKFKTMDPATWKTSDLSDILYNQMNIKEHPDQPIRVSVIIMMKGTIVYVKSYDESSFSGQGKGLMTFLASLGQSYSINHQRVLQHGGGFEQLPTALGIPCTVVWSFATLVNLKATVKRGNHRGLMFRDAKYDIHMFSQNSDMMYFTLPIMSKKLGIIHDRIYHGHIPRNLVVGVNPVRKELKIQVSRPTIEAPLMFKMHSVTATVADSCSVTGKEDDLKTYCPSCPSIAVVSRGPDAVKSRDFMHHENEKAGYHVHGKYFSCEMDISKANTIGRAIGAFAPYNKQPKDLWTSLVMGLRQIRAFFIYFPMAQQCGAIFHWSQSKKSPIRQIEATIRVASESNGEKLFFKGRKMQVRSIIKGVGDDTRAYKINLAYESTPNSLENKLKLQLVRAEVPGLDIKPYAVCLAYENKYPDFNEEMHSIDMNSELSMSGKAKVQYGHGTDCDDPEGEIKARFEYRTTMESREKLKSKGYYKKCMELKKSLAYDGMQEKLPFSEECLKTLYDAGSARHVNIRVDFVKLSDRMRKIITKVKTAAEAGLLPFLNTNWDQFGDDSDGVGGFINIQGTLHDDDTMADVEIETSQGKKKMEDYPLRLGSFWTRRLRNLKLSSSWRRLLKAGIINPCTVAGNYVRTMDNVTYGYEASDCWTLASSHCGSNPSYAVFTKNVGANPPLAMKAFIGGHEVEIYPGSGSVKVDGSSISLDDDGKDQKHMEGDTEIFTMMKWGSTYNIYSFLRVWIAFDGYQAMVIPAPSVKGEHCGLCGNFNRNQFDEMMSKDGETLLKSPADMVQEWQWNC